MTAGGLPSYIVIATDDCYKYYEESIVAFTFMMSMIHKDMHHLLLDLIRKEDPVRIYREIQEHFKGGKNLHVEAARKKLNDHRLGLNIVRYLSTLLELISALEEAQGMAMPESQKFGILRALMVHEERVHVRNIVRTIKKALLSRSRKLEKNEMCCRRTRPTFKSLQQRNPPQRTGFVSSSKHMSVPGKDVRIFTEL